MPKDAWVDIFLGQYNVIYDFPSLYKATLICRYKCRKDSFNFVSYNFRYDFVANVAERDWLESMKESCSFLFGDKSEECWVGTPTDLATPWYFITILWMYLMIIGQQTLRNLVVNPSIPSALLESMLSRVVLISCLVTGFSRIWFVFICTLEGIKFKK